jgi:hypothetical protein
MLIYKEDMATIVSNVEDRATIVWNLSNKDITQCI